MKYWNSLKKLKYLNIINDADVSFKLALVLNFESYVQMKRWTFLKIESFHFLSWYINIIIINYKISTGCLIFFRISLYWEKAYYWRRIKYESACKAGKWEDQKTNENGRFESICRNEIAFEIGKDVRKNWKRWFKIIVWFSK